MDSPGSTADRLADSAAIAAGSKKLTQLQREVQRDEMVNRLRNEEAGDLALPLSNCGSDLRLACTCCGDTRTTETRCRKRWCPVCADSVQRERLKRWSGAVARMQWPLFMTLTQERSIDVESIVKIKAAWSKFRRRKLIREKVLGGVAAFEVTLNERGYHYHLHAIADCRWLSLYTREPRRYDSAEVVRELCGSAKDELASLWAQQLGQELAIVDVSRISGGGATAYILKYATKAGELLANPQPIAPLIRQLRKSRLIAGWGSLHPLPSIAAEHKPGSVCTNCGQETTWFLADELDRAYQSAYNKAHALRSA